MPSAPEAGADRCVRPDTCFGAPRYGNDVKPRALQEFFQICGRPKVGRGHGVRELFHPGAFEEPKEERSASSIASRSRA